MIRTITLLLGLFLVTQGYSEQVLSGIEGSFSTPDGYRIRWKTPEIKAYPKIGFGYAKKAEALIYIPGLKKPFKISSDKLKIDPLNQDLTFEGNVKVTTSKGMLTTNFLNFNRNRWELSSFDEYTFKTPASTIQGRSLHGSAQKRTLTLFQHHKPTKTLIF